MLSWVEHEKIFITSEPGLTKLDDILLKKQNKTNNNNINFIYNRSFCCNHTCYCVAMVYVTPESRYVSSASCFQSWSSMFIRGLIPQNIKELAETGPIVPYRWQWTFSTRLTWQTIKESIFTCWSKPCITFAPLPIVHGFIILQKNARNDEQSKQNQYC